MTQEFNSMLQTQLATDGKISIASMDKKRIAEAGLQALLSTGTFVGSAKVLQTGKVGVQEVRTNLKAMSNEAHARNHVKKVRKYTNKQVENGFMTQEEADVLGWYSRPLVIRLDNDTLLYMSSDDEGNDGGALFGNTEKEELTFPVI